MGGMRPLSLVCLYSPTHVKTADPLTNYCFSDDHFVDQLQGDVFFFAGGPLEELFGVSLLHAPGVRMTVVTLTPSNKGFLQYCSILRECTSSDILDR